MGQDRSDWTQWLHVRFTPNSVEQDSHGPRRDVPKTEIKCVEQVDSGTPVAEDRGHTADKQ